LDDHIEFDKPQKVGVVEGRLDNTLEVESFDLAGQRDITQELGCRGLLSPSGRGVASIPSQVQYSHAGPVGTAEDLSSQMTKSRYHVTSQVIWITCKIT
jgi:hypothetical protein